MWVRSHPYRLFLSCFVLLLGDVVSGLSDQILLKNNVVLHGTIVEQQPGRLVVIRVGAGRHIVWFGQMQRLHRNGQQQDLAAASAPPAATPPAEPAPVK